MKGLPEDPGRALSAVSGLRLPFFPTARPGRGSGPAVLCLAGLVQVAAYAVLFWHGVGRSAKTISASDPAWLMLITLACLLVDAKGRTYTFTRTSPNTTFGNAFAVFVPTDAIFPKGTSCGDGMPADRDVLFRLSYGQSAGKGRRP